MRLMLLGALLIAFTVTTQAASYTKFEALTVAGTAVGFTAANINNTNGSHPNAQMTNCRLELAQIRYTIDGTTPTAAVGMPLEIGDVLVLTGNDTLNNFRAIRTTATSGQLDCTHVGTF